jgi:hypothetical protein
MYTDRVTSVIGVTARSSQHISPAPAEPFTYMEQSEGLMLRGSGRKMTAAPLLWFSR